MARPRLLDRLDEGSPLTLLRAPLGFGKTTLVAQWWSGHLGRQRGDLAAWVTVDRDSADSIGFWQSILDVLVDAGVKPSALVPRRSARLQVRRAIATAGCEVTLVVDAFERVTDSGIDGDLLELLRVSPNLRLVVCLRSQRHFPPHSYLDLDFTIVPAGELLLSVEETEALLGEFGVGDLSEERVRAIHAELGGWVDPTRAFAIAACNSAAMTSPPTDQGLATTVALSYLRQRILPAIGGEYVEFALATSLVDGVSTELAEVLVDDSAAERRLQRLEADEVLYATVEDGETVYRWPPAARRALAAELEATAPEHLRQLHARIARFYATKDRPDSALCHALNAADWPLAVEIIEQHWRVLLVSHPDILYAALAAAPLELIVTSPRALAVRDLQLQGPDDQVLSAIPDLPADPEALRRLGTGPQVAEILDTGLAMIAVLRRRGLFSRAGVYCDRLETVATTAAVNRTTEVASQLPGFWFQLGVTRLLADDIERAGRPLRTAYETAANSTLAYVESDAAAKIALASACAGDTLEATVWLRRHDQAPEEKGWFNRWINTTVNSARVLLALDRLDIKQAAAAAATAVAETGTNEFWAFAAYAHALLALHTGDALGGLRRLDQHRSTYPAWHGPGSTARILLAEVEADLLLSLGRANQARVVLAAANGAHPHLGAAEARLELLTGHPEVALARATDTGWGRHSDPRSQHEMLLVQAVAHHRLGQAGAAAVTLRHALSVTQTTGSLRPFTTVPRAELTAIAKALPADTVAPLFSPALRAQPDLFPVHVELIELTRREQAVLSHLAQGLLVRQIAAHLYISKNTVKAHLKSLYRKLNATSRREALAHAHQLGLHTGQPPTKQRNTPANGTPRSRN